MFNIPVKILIKFKFNIQLVIFTVLQVGIKVSFFVGHPVTYLINFCIFESLYLLIPALIRPALELTCTFTSAFIIWLVRHSFQVGGVGGMNSGGTEGGLMRYRRGIGI